MRDSGLVATLERLMSASVGLTVRALLAIPGIDDLTLTQWRVLAVLSEADSPVRVTDLALRIGASLPSTSRLIARLRDRGLVSMTPAAADRRTSLIHLTDEGRATALEVRRERHRLIADALDGLVDLNGSCDERLTVLCEVIAEYEARTATP